MIIRLLRIRDLEDVVRLHLEILPNTLSSKIGESYLELLYVTLLKHEDIHALYVAEVDRKIVGVVTSTVDLNKTQSFLKTLITFKTVLLILKATFLGKISLSELYRKFHFEKILVTKFTKPYATILTLFVANDYQKKGVGKSLINKIMKQYIILRVRYLYVDTLKSNKDAFGFYKRIGFRVQKAVLDSIILRYNLEKIND